MTAQEVETLRQAPAPSPGQPYGLARGCRVWGLARSTVYWQRHEPARAAVRRGPLGPWPDAELVAQLRRVLETSSFPGAGDRKVGARLRQGGRRTSPRRVWRLRRAPHLLAPTCPGHPPGPPAHAGTIITAHVATMGGTARTNTCTRQEGQGAICIAVDPCSAACVGIQAAKQGTRFAALEPSRQGVRTACGACAHDVARGVVRRHDHGSQSMSHGLQEERRV